MLQVALDLLDKEKCFNICNSIAKYVDLIEAGTPLIKKFGIGIVKELGIFGDVVADMKTMDAGFLEASMAFESGAKYTTVLGLASNKTIREVVRAAKEYGGKVMGDLIGVKDVNQRGMELLDMGVDVVCIHLGIDEQKEKSLIDILKDVELPSKHLAVAGGINLENIDAILKLKPSIVIVGSAITKADSPLYVAKEMRRRIYGIP